MPRSILDESHIHPAIREVVARHHGDVVAEVKTAVGRHDVVVVGMAQNPHVKRARKALRAARVRCKYLEYGSYLGGWRQRTALKMWTGWPTFPMVFVRGVLIGGANDLVRLIAGGELKEMLAVPLPQSAGQPAPPAEVPQSVKSDQ
jgi:monothiol glutaredoxin